MVIRPFRSSDRTAVDALMERRRIADGHPALSEHKAMRLGNSDQDPATIELVLVVGEELLGYAHAAGHPAPAPTLPARSEVEIVVEPGKAEPDRTMALLEAMLDVLPADRLRTVWGWRPGDFEAATRLGLVELRRLHEMRRALPVSRRWRIPSGISVRPFRPGLDDDAWLSVNNAAFAGHPENGALDRSNLAARMSLPWFDPEGFFMAWEGDRLRGYCWTKLHNGGQGEIYIVGVAPEAQGRGLGTALALVSLDDLAERQGATEALLYVDGDQEAPIAFYRGLGFRIVRTLRELTADA